MIEITEAELFEQEMEIEARDARETEIEAAKRKQIPVTALPETGVLNLVRDPLRPEHLIWIPF